MKPSTARRQRRRADPITRTVAPNSRRHTGRSRTVGNSVARAASLLPGWGLGTAVGGLANTVRVSATQPFLSIGKPEKYGRNGEFDFRGDILKPMRPAVADQRDQPPDTPGEHYARQQAHIFGAGRVTTVPRQRAVEPRRSIGIDALTALDCTGAETAARSRPGRRCTAGLQPIRIAGRHAARPEADDYNCEKKSVRALVGARFSVVQGPQKVPCSSARDRI